MYTLFDQEDQDSWEKRRQELDELSALMPSMPGAPPSLAGVDIPPPYAAPSYQPPAAASMPPLAVDDGPDWTDALNVGLVGLGGIVDLAANKGRNFGAIAASGAQYGAARAGQRVEQEKDRLAYEEKRAALERQNQYQQYLYANMAQRGQQQGISNQLRAAGVGQRQQDLDRKDKTEARNQQNYEQENTPGSSRQEALAAWMYEHKFAEPGSLENLTEEQIRANNPRMGQLFDLEHAPEKAREVAEATEPVQTRIAQAGARAGAIGRGEAEKQIGAERTTANVDVTDPDVYRSLNTSQVNDMNKLSRSKVQLEQALDDMAALRRQHGAMVLKGEAKSSYDSAQTLAIGALTSLGETGVLNQKEYERYKERIVNSGLTLGDVQGAVTGDPNVVVNELLGTRAQLSKLYDTALSQYGVRGHTGSSGNAYRAGNGLAQARGAQALPGGTMNAPAAGPATLEAPGMNPAQLGAGARMYLVKKPGFPDLHKMLTPEQVQNLIAGDAQVTPE